MSGFYRLIIPLFLIPFLSAFLLVGSGCTGNRAKHNADTHLPDQSLQEIRQKGILSVITDYNSTTYFIFRGEPMGFHYEMLKKFADYLGVKLDVEISSDLDHTITRLEDSGIDLIALDLSVTRERSELLDFSIPFMQSRQVLVQRNIIKGSASPMSNRGTFIYSPLDLAGKTVHIQKNSAFARRLLHLQEEIGDSIHVVQDANYQVEALISKVARGEIDYTISDEHIALVNRTYYPNINVSTAISFPQHLAWAVPKGSDSLLAVLNNWMEGFVNSSDYRALYNKYFLNRKSIEISEGESLSLHGGRISAFDEDIRKYSKIINWDWRMIASLIYQESRFHPKIQAWSGAFGLMQLMPETAAYFGVDTLSPPEKQIEAGVRYLKYLDDQLAGLVRDPEERKMFMLAAYNVGVGHVLDARRLADKNGKNANAWFGNVDTFMLVKSDPAYYNDSVVYYGYCRGEEPVRFVSEIVQRYEVYRSVISE